MGSKDQDSIGYQQECNGQSSQSRKEATRYVVGRVGCFSFFGEALGELLGSSFEGKVQVKARLVR